MEIIVIEDLASYLGDDTVAGDGRAQMIVNLANGLVSDVVGESATVTTKMQSVVLEVSARAFRNPEGYSSETIDDYTYRRDAETRRAGVYLTSTELSDLRGGVRVRSAWLA
jgi:hypothetical protein